MEDFLVYTLTYNVATKFPASNDDFKQLLGLDPATSQKSTYVKIPDLFVIGLQEVKSQPQNMVWDTLFDDPWTAKIRETLAPFGFVKIQTLRMQGLVTNLFLKRSHLTFLRDIETLWTRRGFGGMWGNKGAVSIRMGIHGCSMCFVNCHLTPHDHLLQDRINDYQEILTGQIFSNKETSNILFHDYVFWLGDLNFRLCGSSSAQYITEAVSKGRCSELLKDDELSIVRQSGHAFSELQELPINFPPTYKFESGLDSYDQKRRPGWTDRILYQVNANAYDNVKLKIDGLNYKSHMTYRASDHKPVTASFTIRVFRPTIEKLIEFPVIDRWYTGESNRVLYRVVPTLDVAPEDWVAVFKADFTSTDEYVAFVYVGGVGEPVIEDNEDSSEGFQTINRPGEFSVAFPENSVNFDGSYVLLYFSQASKSIYGMSNTFESVTRAQPALQE